MTVPVPFVMIDGRVDLNHRRVLRGVTVRVETGEMVAVLGPNGSGKSTLVRALLGLVPLSGGSVELYGVPPARFRDWGRLGYVPQRLTAGGGVPATVREVVTSGRVAKLRRLRPLSAIDRAAVETALAAVDLLDRSGDPVQSLSSGQQQRVLIARALAGEPETLVMDEPTAGIDVASQQALAGALHDLVRRGRTVVLVAHELGPLEPLVARAVVLNDGVVVHDGAPPPVRDHVHPHAGPQLAGELTRWEPA